MAETLKQNILLLCKSDMNIHVLADIRAISDIKKRMGTALVSMELLNVAILALSLLPLDTSDALQMQS